MNWKPISGDRERFNAGVKGQWPKLTDAQIDALSGNRMALIGKIRSVYGISQEQAEKQVASWIKRSVTTASTP
jgi:uncharacterized protein YjbJ (UPF0337 family)